MKWIDGAKGIAMLMVIVVHLSQHVQTLPKWGLQACSFGAMGVQLFFLMSAYCCCLTWSPERFGKSYWWRKYRRLAPWYLVGIVLYALYWLMLGASSKQEAFSFENLLANVTFINGLIPSAQNSIVPGGWSISCIALFIFSFPMVAKLCDPRDSVSQCRMVVQGLVFLLICGIVSVMVPLLGYRYWGWSRTFAYCHPLNQLIVFVIGIGFWHYHEALKACKLTVVFFGAVIFFGAAVAAVLLTREYAIFYRQILIAISFVFGALVLERVECHIPTWLVWIGKHSYEIFILHFAVIWMVLA